jgi:hypothetical protein
MVIMVCSYLCPDIADLSTVQRLSDGRVDLTYGRSAVIQCYMMSILTIYHKCPGCIRRQSGQIPGSDRMEQDCSLRILNAFALHGREGDQTVYFLSLRNGVCTTTFREPSHVELLKTSSVLQGSFKQSRQMLLAILANNIPYTWGEI